MSLHDPLASTALLLCDDDQGRAHFAGTCLPFRSPSHFLTAAHCVKGVAPERLSVSTYLDEVERGFDVDSVTQHPKADIALVHTSESFAGILKPFQSVNGVYGAGDGVAAFGYPEDATDSGLKPVPRMFRGFLQRVFDHKSYLGYEYVADEFSFSIPQGLSGGPVVFDRNPMEVGAVAVESVEAATYIRTITEIVEQHREYHEKVQAVVQYGIAVRLEHVEDWLDQHVPRAGA